MRRGRTRKGRRWRRERRPPGRITVVPDAEPVFDAAIAAGVFSDDPSDRRWAGHYMYLFHDEHGTAWFKHRDTRAHVLVSGRRLTRAGYAA